MRNKATLAAVALTLVTGISRAEARRFRFFGIPGFGRSETIDRVSDLPDRAPFERDGDFLDLGYLHALSKGNDSYVLYHGDKYVKLDESDLAMLTTVLGSDPTTDYRAEHADEAAAAAAEAKAQRAPFEAKLARGEAIERRPGESSEDYGRRKAAFIAKVRASNTNASSNDAAPPAGSGGASIGLIVALLVIVGVVLAFWRKLSRKTGALLFTDAGEREALAGLTPPVAADSTLSFDQRVAQRLAELRSPSADGSVELEPTITASPAPQGFGRKRA